MLKLGLNYTVNFEAHTSLNLSFNNIQVLHSNFVISEFFHELDFSGILTLC